MQDTQLSTTLLDALQFFKYPKVCILRCPSIVNFGTVSGSGFWIARNTQFFCCCYCLCHTVTMFVVLDLLLFVWGNFAMTKHPCNINLHVTCIVYYWMKKHNIKVESIIWKYVDIGTLNTETECWFLQFICNCTYQTRV